MRFDATIGGVTHGNCHGYDKSSLFDDDIFVRFLVGKIIEMPRVWTYLSYVLSPASAIFVGGVISMEESRFY